MDPTASLQPIEENAPCGPDLEYDPDFLTMETAASGTQDHQIGEAIIKGEEPDWKEALRLSSQILTRTYDLRVAIIHTQSLVSLEGFPGFAKGLSFIAKMLDTFWDTLHPELDPAEGHDPIMRANVLSALNDRRTTLNLLRNTSLVNSRIFGVWSLNEIAIARGDSELPEGRDRPDIASYDAALRETGHENISEVVHAIGTAIKTSEHIRDFFSHHGGLLLDDLLRELRQAHFLLAPALELENEENRENFHEDECTIGSHTGKKTGSFTGTVINRTDVLRALDEVCAYYKRSEPSSPVPLLLHRARRLVDLDFYSIIKDLAPDGELQVLNIRGARPEDDDEKFGSTD
ncbi:hypothetical protein PsAD2_03889 [Pseudovibrio axinellae]|uniref:ImpA N-terminal domain-containing protein n=1 Tax=Pseudovibrio axinellae TaxID=989403 RepID=A0A165UMX1_9HYPH|nr:type VI secretion system protein TssA [Pseudovibrio axinellae]KZL12583.1 hypothetical protein PsAD2_03889 [Pseudovibrio axinellae]SEP65770.1 type VI secretion system protein ImpA [Pseudovibrio axinellae]